MRNFLNIGDEIFNVKYIKSIHHIKKNEEGEHYKLITVCAIPERGNWDGDSETIYNKGTLAFERIKSFMEATE